MQSKPKASTGMRVELTLYREGPDYGTIIGVEKDACIVRLDKRIKIDEADGISPAVVAVPWHEVRLMEVEPDLETGGGYHASAKVKVIAPGEHVMIDIGDGNSDKPGVIVQAMPGYAVVRLDEPLAYGGSRHAAADWHLITLRAPDDEAQAVAAAMDAGLGGGEE